MENVTVILVLIWVTNHELHIFEKLNGNKGTHLATHPIRLHFGFNRRYW